MRAHAALLALLLLCMPATACFSTDPAPIPRKGVLTSSTLDGTRLLSSLSEDERQWFCAAATATLYSATGPEKECEIEGVFYAQTTPAIGGQQVSDCGMVSYRCFEGGLIDNAALKCDQQIESSTTCDATVRDGERCSVQTATRRANVLPDVSCASSVPAIKAAIPKIAEAYGFAATSECARYMTCRTGY